MSGGDLINSLTSNLPIFFFTKYYDISAVGLYFFTYRVFSAPMGMLGMAVAQVMLKDFADKVIYKKTILKSFIKISLVLVIAAISYYFVAIIVSQYALLIFGH